MEEIRIDTYTAGDNVAIKVTNQNTFETIEIKCKQHNAKKLRKLAVNLIKKGA